MDNGRLEFETLNGRLRERDEFECKKCCQLPDTVADTDPSRHRWLLHFIQEDTGIEIVLRSSSQLHIVFEVKEASISTPASRIIEINFTGFMQHAPCTASQCSFEF
ncbi:hypothetical protein NX059_008356 [Plenodomus lindquistii]|nr:hypothetical protein NX059_008356 [Plenodomus lindquistii]